MPSDHEKLTARGLINRILEPHHSIKDITLRRQAYFTTLVSLVLGAVDLIAIILALLG